MLSMSLVKTSVDNVPQLFYRNVDHGKLLFHSKQSQFIQGQHVAPTLSNQFIGVTSCPRFKLCLIMLDDV